MAFDDVISRQALPFASPGALSTKRDAERPHIKSICIEIEVHRHYRKKKVARPAKAYGKIDWYQIARGLRRTTRNEFKKRSML